jgi:hypothetical protein
MCFVSKDSAGTENTLFRMNYSSSAGDILTFWNDWQEQVGRMFTIAEDFVECRFAVADMPHYIICLGVGRNIDA